jgi:hypothetical protein
MSEFKFACPVCGQHITADSQTTGSQLECPTCFQKLIVPQAPSRTDAKLIVAASLASKPRPLPTEANADSAPIAPPRRSSSVLALVGVLVLLGAAGAAVFAFRDRIFHHADAKSPATGGSRSNAPPKLPARTVYPIPTNILWSLELTNAVIPETTAVGSIHGLGFRCEKAFLTGGTLTLRQGKSAQSDLGVAVQLHARVGEDLSGKTVDVSPGRPPSPPRVLVRWRDEQDHFPTQMIPGGYLLHIVFGEAENNRMPGRIYLSLPDDAKSFVAGTFTAEIRKPPPAKPKQPSSPPAPKT